MKKLCRKCKIHLAVNSFHVNNSSKDKLCTQCKKCMKKYGKFYWLHNRKRLIKRANKWKKEHPARTKELHAKAVKKYREKHRNRCRARNQVLNYLRDSKLTRGNCCVCKKLYGEESLGLVHHCDYSKPFEIQWLCKKHHNAWHRVFITEDRL